MALLLALGQGPALAAMIPVTARSPAISADGQCSLIEAMVNANDDAATHADCEPGHGADTIVLPQGSTQTLTTINNSTYGPTGLPVITSPMTITGDGSTIARTRNAPPFRIFAVDSTGQLTLQEATVSGGEVVSGNVFHEYSGGGVANVGGTMTLTQSTISGNSGLSEDGFLYGAVFGGGIYNRSATMILTSSTVSGNSALGSGGGVFNYDGTMTVIQSAISGNTVSGYFGGGVANYYGLMSLTQSTVSGNGAYIGGGVYNRSGTMTLTQSTISGNTASGYLGYYGYGGGILNYDGLITLTQSTISGNSAAYYIGGVANVDGTLTLARTLVSGNLAGDTALFGREVAHYGSGEVSAEDFNLFGVDGDAGVTGFSPGPTDVVPSPGVLIADILEPELAANGGPTLTHALVPGSPAVDAVLEGCPPPATDQRGFSRPADGNGDTVARCDIGAVEFQPEEPAVRAVNGRAEGLGTPNAKVTMEGQIADVSLTDLDLGASTLTITSILTEAGVELVAGASLPLTLEARPGSDADGATFETLGGTRPKMRLDLSHRGEGVVSFRLVVEFAPSENPSTCAGTPRTTELTTSFHLEPTSVSLTTTQPWQCLAGDSQLRVPVP